MHNKFWPDTPITVNKFNLITSAIFFSLVLNTPPAIAQDLSELDKARAELQKKEETKAANEARRKDAEKQLKQVKQDLIKSASKSQSIERELIKLDARKKDLKQQQAVLTDKLLEDQGVSAALFRQIYAARQVPAYGIYFTQDNKADVIQRSIAMNQTIPGLHKRMARAQGQIKQLKDLQTEIDDLITAQNKEITKLQLNSAELKRMADKRRALYKDANSDYERSLREIKRLREESENLQELIGNLKPTSKPSDIKPAVVKGNNGRFMPVAVDIKGKYGEKDEIGAKSQGIIFTTQAKAVVVAPSAGKVVFSGPFQHYKNLLILEHSDGYHSLIAGLDDIATDVGAQINAGEPVGTIERSNNQKGRLYYELRKNGKAVKPNGFLNIQNG